MQPPKEVVNPMLPKKKPSKKKVSPIQSQGQSVKGIQGLPRPSPVGKKGMKRIFQNNAPPSYQQPERSNSDSLPDSSVSGNEYRALRRKYLLLEEESFSLGRELGEVEHEVRSLENEKLALLDQLVVLEGLIDPAV